MTETEQAPRRRKFTDQCFVVNLLPDEFVLAEGVAGFSCDGVNGSLLHLLLDGTVQHEQRLAGTLLVRGEAQGQELSAAPAERDFPQAAIISRLSREGK